MNLLFFNIGYWKKKIKVLETIKGNFKMQKENFEFNLSFKNATNMPLDI